jgi:hypothetical protein
MNSCGHDDILLFFGQFLGNLEFSGFGEVRGTENSLKAILPGSLNDLLTVGLEFLRREMGVRIDELQDISFVLILSGYCSIILFFR